MVRLFFHCDSKTLRRTARSNEDGFSTASISNIAALARLNGCGDLAGDASIQPSYIAKAIEYRVTACKAGFLGRA